MFNRGMGREVIEMSYDTDILDDALNKIELMADSHERILHGQIATARASLKNIITDMDSLIADCDRLRRELDDEMGIMR